MSDFIDPYAHLDKEHIVNTSISVSKADQAFLMSLFSHRSVLQTTINILLSRFITTLKQNGLQPGYNPHRFRNAIATLNITCNTSGGGGTVAHNEPATERKDQPLQANSGDVGQGTGGVVSTSPGLPVAALNPSGALKGRGGNKDQGQSKKG